MSLIQGALLHSASVELVLKLEGQGLVKCWEWGEPLENTQAGSAEVGSESWDLIKVLGALQVQWCFLRTF